MSMSMKRLNIKLIYKERDSNVWILKPRTAPLSWYLMRIQGRFPKMSHSVPVTGYFHSARCLMAGVPNLWVADQYLLGLLGTQEPGYTAGGELEHNAFDSLQSHPPPQGTREKVYSMKQVPGGKKVGDHSLVFIRTYTHTHTHTHTHPWGPALSPPYSMFSIKPLLNIHCEPGTGTAPQWSKDLNWLPRAT